MHLKDSVRAPRAQCDKKAYQFRMKHVLENTDNVDMHQGNVSEILVEDDLIVGIVTNLGIEYKTSSVIVSSGTFMRGLMPWENKTNLVAEWEMVFLHYPTV